MSWVHRLNVRDGISVQRQIEGASHTMFQRSMHRGISQTLSDSKITNGLTAVPQWDCVAREPVSEAALRNLRHVRL